MKKRGTFLLAISIAMLTITPTVDASAAGSVKVNLFDENRIESINNSYPSLNEFNCYNVSDIRSDNLTEKKSTSKTLLIGRFDTSDAAGPKFAWSNTTIKANFVGTGISVNLKSTGDNWFNVIVDGVVQTPINVTSTTSSPIALVSGLEKGKHTIELVKRTEAFVGDVQFLGFSVSDGKLLNPPKPSSKRILFIGDSITCGYGNEGTDPNKSFTTKNENASLAYGALTAKLLGADPMTICWSGKGVLRNYGGDPKDVMPEIYNQVLPYNKNLTWNPKNWVPQVIVINLSTNDYSVGIPDKTTFTAVYSKFIDNIRSEYPKADIYCAIGPMLNGENLDSQRDYISGIVKSKEASIHNKVHFIEFPQQDFANGLGEDWHPSVKTHELMAKQLAEKIKTDLGWKVYSGN
ncbi:SGNH/GDSL hydrolase family protein [Clostridium cellulovorans]|uniref:Lipolytic protein G-D-S-L family n=2 Tax=Clostridium cellulovorans TaxID=1493 RepID=D9SNT7_CLOC7|nr:SGNH/GDSL hydrolase family protein [Clostridium cellulovorans]ADL49958.1 lipolytic protein G-D-S-L family [Clostridium cellulovorans 743B]BAV13142.1 acetylxylan esterase [Clostridium cellulovorans]